MFKKSIAFLVVCSLLLAMFAFNIAVAAPKEVKISIIYATGDPLTRQLIHDSVVAFTKANPNIKMIEDLTAGTMGYSDTLKVKDAVGEFPDFVEMRDTPTLFVRAGKLAPLPKEVAKLIDNPVPIYGTVYTAPYAAQYPNGIFYNKKFFAANGFTEPKTYGEFLQLCEKIKARGVAPIVAGIKDIWHVGFWFGKYWADNIGTVDPNWIAKRYEGKVHFSDPQFANGIKQMVELFTKGYVEAGYLSTTESQCPSILVSGKAAMYYCGTFVISQIMEADPTFELGWFPVPDDKGKVKLLGGATAQGWALSAEAAKDPEKVKAFVKFMKFFFSKNRYTNLTKQMNGFPTTKQQIVYEPNNPVMLPILKTFAKAPKCLNWNNGVGANELPPPFRNWTYKKLQEAMIGSISAQDVVKAMDEEWEKEIRDYNPSKFTAAKLVPPTPVPTAQ